MGHTARMRHRGLLSFFWFFEFENSSEDFPEIGNGFKQKLIRRPHPHIFYGEKKYLSDSIQIQDYMQ